MQTRARGLAAFGSHYLTRACGRMDAECIVSLKTKEPRKNKQSGGEHLFSREHAELPVAHNFMLHWDCEAREVIRSTSPKCVCVLVSEEVIELELTCLSTCGGAFALMCVLFAACVLAADDAILLAFLLAQIVHELWIRFFGLLWAY